MSLEDIITKVTIQQVKDIRTERHRTYGGPTNSYEFASMQSSEQELMIIEKFFEVYFHLQEHLKYKPGGEGAKVAEQDFYTISKNN